jgi:predicted NBD/HSP70 family sugar kinase
LRGTVLASGSAPLPDHDPRDVVGVIAALTAEVGAGHPTATGLGVALGGRSPDGATVTRAPFLGWQDVPLGDLVATRTSIPTVIANDVAALTAAEHWFGVGRGLANFAVITLGVGVGYALVIHDRLVSHHDLGIGLIGHYPLGAGGALCDRGHRGCASAALTIGGLTAQAAAALGRPVGWDELLELGASGHPVAERLLADAGVGLGRLIAAVANLTMVDRIVLAGEGVALVGATRGAVNDGIAADREPEAAAVDVVVIPGDFTRWARGAAVAAIQDFALHVPGEG